ncbi:MAG TPA: hypothetical protein VHL11_06535 [Phototrophicaceae bacterium]|jgi:hypothetical protein|nr:hypothetical protein [Phototrophicaceae bacterium]
MNMQQTKNLTITLMATVLLIMILLVSVIPLTQAQQQSTGDPAEDAAIVLAAGHTAFASGLSAHPGWTAAAYNTKNTYGIWRVQFWDVNGEDLGWADVNPVKARVYSWESHVGVTDAQKIAAEPALRSVVATAPEVLELMENPSQYEMYVDYNSWAKAWGVYIANGADSLYVLVQFDDDTALTNPKVLGIYFELMSYDEWFSSNKDLATATAFDQPEIAAAVRDVAGWQSEVERSGDLWTVYFKAEDQVLAQATVNLDSGKVVDFKVSG